MHVVNRQSENDRRIGASST